MSACHWNPSPATCKAHYFPPAPRAFPVYLEDTRPQRNVAHLDFRLPLCDSSTGGLRISITDVPGLHSGQYSSSLTSPALEDSETIGTLGPVRAALVEARQQMERHTLNRFRGDVCIRIKIGITYRKERAKYIVLH